jgi:hypothetical protein
MCVMTNPVFRFAPGPSTAIVAGPVGVLLDRSATDDLAIAVYTALAGEATVEAAMDALASRGLTAMPDFALVRAGDESIRLIVRGQALVQPEIGPTIASQGFFTDTAVAPDQAVGLVLGPVGPNPTAYEFPGPVGMVAAEALWLAEAEEAEPGSESGSGSEVTGLRNLRPVRAVTVGLDDLFAYGDEAAPGAAAGAAPIPPDFADLTRGSGAVSAAAGPSVPSAPSGPGELGELGVTGVSASGLSVPTALPSPTAVHDLPPLGGPVTESQPLTWLSAPSAPSAGQRTLVPAPGAAQGNLGSLVIAASCPEGHYNPPWEKVCRQCGRPVSPQPLSEVQRPSLGVLRLSSGGTVNLDRGAVFGRNPRVIPQAGRMPRLVRIADPNRDISSQHLEVRLEDWLVTVIDLDSTNGTQVVAPGKPSAPLRPHEPLAIDPGTRVILARAFHFVYELAE